MQMKNDKYQFAKDYYNFYRKYREPIIQSTGTELDYDSFVEKNNEGPFALKASYNYFSELLEGENFFVDISIFDFDLKRVHVFGEMRKNKSLELSAVFETVLMNMDLSARKVKPYPERVLELFKLFKASLDQDKIPLEIGKKITLKK